MINYRLDVPCITIQIKNKEEKMNSKIRDLVRLSIVAALYVLFTVVNPFSYNAIQFRISEILVLLCFFRKDYSIALIIGCFISNFFSGFVLYDIIFGTIATVLTLHMTLKNLVVLQEAT